MLKLTRHHRQVYAEKMLDTGNIAVGALVFGQFVSQSPFSWTITFFGLAVLLASFLISYFLLKGE